MAFRAQDLRVSTRRVAGRERRQLYPRLLKDGRINPQLAIAIRYLETRLGLARKELDDAALLQLIGDPKLARCLVACLSSSYRYRSRSFQDLFGSARAGALADRGLATPRELRAAAYTAAAERGGFVGQADRAEFLQRLAPELDPVEVEQALWLDAPDQAVLIRVGPVPVVEEILARFHLRTLESLFRVSPAITLELRGDPRMVELICERHDVRITCNSGMVTLHGQHDAFGSWARHGKRVARAALLLLTEGLLGPGEAVVALGDEQYELQVSPTLLRATLPARGWFTLPAQWQVAARFFDDLAGVRRAGRLTGWRLQQWPAPLIAEHGAIWPEALLTRGTIAIGLLPVAGEQVRARRVHLQALSEHLPFILLIDGDPGRLPAGIGHMRLDLPGAAERLADYLDETFPRHAAEATPAWLSALAEATRAAGSLAESELARRLDCAEDVVAERLEPLVTSAADLVYIEAFGLSSDDFLGRARQLVESEITRNGGRLDLGTVGRKLRILAGRNEGLHGLIGYLLPEPVNNATLAA